MSTDESEWRVEFFKTARGDSPPVDYIQQLEAKDRAKIAYQIELLKKFGVQLGEPYAKPLLKHKPLWELRPMPTRLVYFAFTGRRFIILHAFTKKKDKTDRREIKTAENRMAEYLERHK
jgi:phage-related protein